MWDGHASSSPLGVLLHGEDGALELAGTEVRYERLSVIRIDEKVERGWIGGALGRIPAWSSRTIADRQLI
jgi:hypothetical protein